MSYGCFLSGSFHDLARLARSMTKQSSAPRFQGVAVLFSFTGSKERQVQLSIFQLTLSLLVAHQVRGVGKARYPLRCLGGARQFARAVDPADLLDDLGVCQGGDIARIHAAGDGPEDAAHDLAGAGLRHVGDDEH